MKIKLAALIIAVAALIVFAQNGPSGFYTSNLRVSEIFVMDDGFFVKFENTTLPDHWGWHIRIPLPLTQGLPVDVYKSWLATFITAKTNGMTVQIWRDSDPPSTSSYLELPTINAVRIEGP